MVIRQEDNPLVSVIVPTYNNARYIDKCISSLLKQTYINIEVIIVDDGSEDMTPQIVKDMYKHDQRILYIKQDNMGVCVARNNGIDKAKGKYLLFVDSDDYLQEKYIDHLVRSAEANHSELVIGGYSLVKEDGSLISKVVPIKYKQFEDEMSAYRICAVCSRLYLRDYWKNNELQFMYEKDARGEDTPIAYYANLTAKNISIVNDSGYCYVQHQGSAMDGLRGFKRYHFPYNTFYYYIQKSFTAPAQNSKKYYEIGVCKLFAQFAFLLSSGADKEKICELKNYIYEINQKDICLKLDYSKFIMVICSRLPLTHKIAILLLSFGIKSKLLYMMMMVCSKLKWIDG